MRRRVDSRNFELRLTFKFHRQEERRETELRFVSLMVVVVVVEVSIIKLRCSHVRSETKLATYSKLRDMKKLPCCRRRQLHAKQNLRRVLYAQDYVLERKKSLWVSGRLYARCDLPILRKVGTAGTIRWSRIFFFLSLALSCAEQSHATNGFHAPTLEWSP